MSFDNLDLEEILEIIVDVLYFLVDVWRWLLIIIAYVRGESKEHAHYVQTTILNKDTVGPLDHFSMTCDITKFTDVYIPPHLNITMLGMARSVQNKEPEVFAYYYDLTLGDDALYTYVPEGRNWYFMYQRGNASNNRNSTNLVMYVSDASCDDAGIYWCMLQLPGIQESFFSRPFYLYPKAPKFKGDVNGCKISNASNTSLVETLIINKGIIGNNDQFTITCDSDKFLTTDLPPMAYYEKIGVVQKLRYQKETVIAMYWPFAPEGDPLELRVPNGRQWEVKYSGGEKIVNKDTLKLEITAKNASCEDAGTYKCVVKLPSIEKLFFSSQFFLYPRGAENADDKEACPLKPWSPILEFSKAGASCTDKSTVQILQRCALAAVLTLLMLP